MKRACFTGHRNVEDSGTADLRQRLISILERGITNEGLTDFYAGGAIGWDTMCAEAVLALKEKYGHIKLHMVLPCSNREQTYRWTREQQKTFYEILSQADTVEYTSDSYYQGCMKVRNARLVELADICFCYLDKSKKKSGTAQTVRMALKKHIMVVNFWRDTSE